MYTCKRCHNPVSEGCNFCLSCGTPVEVDLSQPAPGTAAPTATLTASPAIANIKKYLNYIVLGVSVLALIVGLLNLFGLFDATAVVSGYGRRQTSSGPVTDLYEGKPLVLISNLLYGLISLAIAFIGTAYYLKATMNHDMYDKYIAKAAAPKLQKFVAGDGVLTLMGILGAANVIFQWFLYLFTRESVWGASAWIRIHWTSWVMLFVYLAAAGCDMFLLNKKEK